MLSSSPDGYGSGPDVAYAALWLTSDEAWGVTGIDVGIDVGIDGGDAIRTRPLQRGS